MRSKLGVSAAPDYSRRKRPVRQKAGSARSGRLARRARTVLADAKKKAADSIKAARQELPLVAGVMSELAAGDKIGG